MGQKEQRSICVAEMVALMERLAPPFLAESWDNCGLQVGDLKWPVKKVWVALDPLLPTISSAARQQIDLVITHHPLIFKPLRKIDLDTIEGKIISTALGARTAIYSAHTNLDSAREGINDLLARKIGLAHLAAMVPAKAGEGREHGHLDPPVMGMGRIGILDPPLTVGQLAQEIKEKLRLEKVKVAGQMDRIVRKAAVCSGSGGGLLADFMASDADVFVSGDLRYHDARSVEDAGRALIDVGHFASEHLIVDALCRQLSQIVTESGWDVQIAPCLMEQDPFEFV